MGVRAGQCPTDKSVFPLSLYCKRISLTPPSDLRMVIL